MMIIQMRKIAFVMFVGLGQFLTLPARAERVLLTCLWQSTEPHPQQQTVEVAFDQATQRAEVAGNGYVPAVISDTQISFVLGVQTTAAIYFTIDRTTGIITVKGKYEVLFNGKCAIADPTHRAF
jgi:hypothetical protein